MTIYLVRHGKAGSRHDWKGPDDQRPLSKRGWRQAEGLVELLVARGVVSVCSSPSLRCVQTVRPLAETLGSTVEERSQLAEGTTKADIAGFIDQLVSARSSGDPVAVCTHGDVIPIILDIVASERGLVLPDDYPCAKGSVWELVDDAGGAMSARYLRPPR